VRKDLDLCEVLLSPTVCFLIPARYRRFVADTRPDLNISNPPSSVEILSIIVSRDGQTIEINVTRSAGASRLIGLCTTVLRSVDLEKEVAMKKVSRILIAYDGSSCSDAALADLGSAGLPMTIDAVVVTVADIIVPPADDELPSDDVPAVRIPKVERHAKERRERAVNEAQAFADQGAKRVKANFPGWNVRTEVRCDSPAWAILEIAGRDKSELIVVGAQGHSLLGGRLILGSVSQRVLYEARCSVRVARCLNEKGNGPVRIVVGFNGSPDSELAVDAVASREWPDGSEARLITVAPLLSSEARDIAVEKLREAGLTTSEISKNGDPAHVLMTEADEWGADSIFLGTRDIHGFQHLLHGSVSSAVAAQARCAVEVSRAMSGTSQARVSSGTL
jgi:nucleotide-binding universal stress UspA family protein